MTSQNVSPFGNFPHQRRMLQWLNAFGFSTNPFVSNQADQEGESLLSFFVDRPYFGQIRGDPSFPRTAFLAARRGEGKTATRKMIAHDVSRPDPRQPRALPVDYFDFGPLLQEVGGDPARVTSQHHAAALARALFNALLSQQVGPARFEYLDEVQKGLALSAIEAFADPLTKLQLKMMIHAEPMTGIDWRALSPVELLTELTNILLHLGGDNHPLYRSIYFLVDRVDESPAGLNGAAALLRSLIEERPLLEMPHVAFKFFLPVEVLDQIRRITPLREDRVIVRTISWDANALADMLEQRLTYFSSGHTERFEALCHPTIKVKQWAWNRLLQTAENSPRNLLRLCEWVLERHLASDDATNMHFKKDDIDYAVSELKQVYELEAAPPHPVAAVSAAQTGETRAVRIDDSGHVWRNGVLLSPPLSDLEFRLLRALYRQSPEIVANEDLIDAVWSDLDMSGGNEVADKQNLRKLVGRLRERLEAPGADEQHALIRNARGRGYWLNLTVTAPVSTEVTSA